LQTLISHTGLGKTIVLERLCESLPRYRRWAFRMNVKCSDCEFYRFALAELGGQPDDADVRELRERLVALTVKLQKGSNGFLLIFDEAQNLSDSVLSELAQLIERSPARPQLILSGQPALADTLRSVRHSRLRSAIAGEYTLSSLTAQEVATYINQRLCIAGYPSSAFSDEAMKAIVESSHGVPRMINNICWTVMSSKTSQPYTSEDVRQAIENMHLPTPEDAVIPTLRAPAQRATAAPAAKETIATTFTPDALQDWLRHLVRWKGTAGELLEELSQFGNARQILQISPRDLLDRLDSDRATLEARGIVAEVKTREGLPPLISLRFDPAKVQVPEKSAPPIEYAPPENAEQPLASESKPARPNRWRAIHLWTLAMVIVAAAVAITVRASEESAARQQPIRPVPVSLDAVPVPGSDPIALEQRSAEAGDPAAQRRIGLHYERGDGVPQDHAVGVQWLRRAAGNRDVESQYLLGIALANNDRLEAYKWFVLSHSAGWQQSLPEIQRLTPQLSKADIGRVRFELALAYTNGDGVPVDLSQAYIWMTLAKAAGVPDSDRELQRIAQRMSSEEIIGASHKADAWLARIHEPITR
jgi:type II secretory pathway predicted ATPase ExeA